MFIKIIMNLLSTFDRIHFQAKHNRWLRYFTVFNRIALAAGFLPSGFVKIMGERFTALSSHHPMGHYLQALFETGYYYPFIGVIQVTAAIFLLIPRTATLGALIYFPIILNICVLSLSVRFDGSLVSSPLMVLANLYLLCWDYDKLKNILPFSQPIQEPKQLNNQFPVVFFAGVFLAVLTVGFTLTNVYDIKPRNTWSDCTSQFKNNDPVIKKAGEHFCDCIHKKGKPLNTSIDEFEKTVKKAGIK